MKKLLQKLAVATLGIAAIASVEQINPANAALVNLNVKGNLSSQLLLPDPDYGDFDSTQRIFGRLLKGSFEGTFSFDDNQANFLNSGSGSYQVIDFNINLFQPDGNLFSTLTSIPPDDFECYGSECPSPSGFIKFSDTGALNFYWALIEGDQALHLRFMMPDGIYTAFPPKAENFLGVTFMHGYVSAMLVGGVFVEDATITVAAQSPESIPEPSTAGGLAILGLGWLLNKKIASSQNA